MLSASTTAGCSDAWVDGRMDLKRLLMSSCAGDFPQLEIGVVRYSSKAVYRSRPLAAALTMILSAVCTAFSANPFDCGYRGLDVQCRNHHDSANWANSALANCGPLSVTSFSGIPCLANIAFNSLMTDVALVEYSLSTSMYRL